MPLFNIEQSIKRLKHFEVTKIYLSSKRWIWTTEVEISGVYVGVSHVNRFFSCLCFGVMGTLLNCMKHWVLQQRYTKIED